LPDTEVGGAHNLARRISDCLANDPEQPTISFSFGVASYPEDGATFDQILGKADVFLYEMKRRNIREISASS